MTTTPHTTPAAILPELLDLIRFQQEYMEAIPDDVRSRFPAMPSYDGDWAVDLVERAKALAASPNTTASGAADDSLLICASDLQHSAIYDNPHEMVDCVRAVADRITALAASAPVAPAPQPAPMPYPTDAQIDAVYEQTMSKHLRSQDAPAVRRFGRAMFLCAWNAAAPKAAPQQGEYLPLPECDATTVGLGAVWNRHGVRAAIDADRAARGVAQAAPITEAEQAVWHAGPDEGRSQARVPLQQGEYLPLPECDPWHQAVIDACFQVESCYVGADPVKTVNNLIDWHVQNERGAAQAAPAPVAGDADPLQGAANWLITSHIITSATTLGGRLCIGSNRAERLFSAARAQAAQPEGGANANR